MTTTPLYARGLPVSRRGFNRLAAGFLLGASVDPRLVRSPNYTAPSASIDGARVNLILSELERYGGTAAGGTTRLAYSDQDLAARGYVTGRMEEAGLTVRIDAAGNLIGSRSGQAPGARPILIGSHIDSVPLGGSYDGQVGSAGALEVALTLQDQSALLQHPLEVVIFQNEEGGKTGSRALVGRVEPFELDIATASGFTIGEGTRRLGGDPTRLDDALRAKGSIHGFLELHIEQGAVLEREQFQIGVVEGIVGIRRWNVTVVGAANHAGTTPMNQRRDALVAASDFVAAVYEIASSEDGRQVATVGKIEAVPGAPNVVPGRVDATLEIRDLSMERITYLFDRIRAASADIDAKRDVTTEFSQFYESLGAPTDSRFRAMIEESADDLGYSSLRMPSGAGHDAQSMAEIGPVGMIFVPSKGGVSHSPKEWTDPEDVARGTGVLYESVLRLDRAED